MSSPLNQYQNMALDLISQYGQTDLYDGFRPNYAPPGSESSLFTSIGLRVDPSGARGVMNNPFPGVVYYVVSGLKSVLLPGDRIQPQGTTGSPISTILQNTEMSDCIAMRTQHIGQIESTTRDNILYNNVYFDYITGASHTGPVIPEFSESLQFESNRVVIYQREQIKKGMRLIAPNGRRMLILAVAENENHLILQLQGDPR